MNKQKVQNNKQIHQDFQDYRYKDNKKTLEMVLLLAVIHPLQAENQRTRSLREIYQHNNDYEQQGHFSFLSIQPTYFEEAVKEEHWVEAMNEEIEAIEKNKTWDLVDLPKDKSSIGVKWVYKTKVNEKGKVEKHKARLVSKGFSQQPGIDYGETFSPVARLDTIRTILATATQNKWQVYQLDVKSTFLNGHFARRSVCGSTTWF
jgi:hypothetical protein